MFRRDFLRLIGLAPLTMVAPQVFAQLAPLARSGGALNRRVLVLLELKGGNDGLNMIVPFGDPAYYTSRARLAIAREQVIQLSDQLGLNPALEALHAGWQQGETAIALGVGYPDPNRSHFRSIDIWETGSDSHEFLTEGWLSRICGQVTWSDPLEGIVIGGDLGPLSGNGLHAVTMNDPQQFMKQAGKFSARKAEDAGASNGALAHLLDVQRNVSATGRELKANLQDRPKAAAPFPASQIGRQLRTAAELITSGTPVGVIKVAHGSFDTHSNQRNQHDRLLRELAEALAAFRAELQAQGHWDRVLVMTYSEFGRRVRENGSGGTDHGTAAPHLLMGGKVKGGFYGDQPALDRLEGGDLKFKLDYRSLYATAIHDWWGLGNVALGKSQFPALGCIKA